MFVAIQLFSQRPKWSVWTIWNGISEVLIIYSSPSLEREEGLTNKHVIVMDVLFHFFARKYSSPSSVLFFLWHSASNHHDALSYVSQIQVQNTVYLDTFYNPDHQLKWIFQNPMFLT